MWQEIAREKIKEWAIQRRSFCIFNCQPDFSSAVASILQEKLPGLTVARASNLQKLPDKTPALLLLDISAKHAHEHAQILQGVIVQIVCWNGNPVFLLSPDSSENWQRGDLWLGDGRIDQNGLLLDLMHSILTGDSLVIHQPEDLDIVRDDPMQTPIEEAMAKELRNNHLDFKPQATIGNYHVDFLVRMNGANVVVECDGAAYHSSEAARQHDRQRDEDLTRQGFRVFRFTGREIRSNAEGCVKQIVNFLKGELGERSERLRREFDKLDESQEKAVKLDIGPARVLAPAGAGKTRVLTNRNVYFANLGFQKHRILALAFNKEAQKEMKGRLKDKGLAEINVRTFNSFGHWFLTKVVGINLRDIEKHQSQLIKKLFDLIKENGIELRRERGAPGQLLEAIWRIKDELKPPGQFLSLACLDIGSDSRIPGPGDPLWSKIFEEFLKHQQDSGLLTFADQIYLTVRKLAQDPVLRRRLQDSYDAILVDEFQDLDAGQLKLLQILAYAHHNVFVVGDDDQMIYGWRGADIAHIQDFPKVYRNSQNATLAINYRCAKRVIRHANFLIEKNDMREDKGDVRPRHDAPPGIVEL